MGHQIILLIAFQVMLQEDEDEKMEKKIRKN